MSSPTPQTIITPSQISIHSSNSSPYASHTLIYFITGNPGLIGYYNTYLTTLYTLLASSQPQTAFHIHGQSLAGFIDTPSDARTTPYSLEEQILHSLSGLQSQLIPSGLKKDQQYDNVIIIGHSVGSYILLELIKGLGKTSPINVIAGILLFPTVTHIAKSPSGVKISTLFRIPNFPRRAGFLAKALIKLAPGNALKWLVGVVARMPREAAEVTTGFLRSRMGVWQALHMAKDEMEFITEDKWDDDMWGIEHEDPDTKSRTPRLIFYFGQNDHWVADHTRDALIAARGREEGSRSSSKPIMMIDDNRIPHGFCIRHSESIAEKTSAWMKDIMEDS